LGAGRPGPGEQKYEQNGNNAVRSQNTIGEQQRKNKPSGTSLVVLMHKKGMDDDGVLGNDL
jgi:hypothetical protein